MIHYNVLLVAYHLFISLTKIAKYPNKSSGKIPRFNSKKYKKVMVDFNIPGKLKFCETLFAFIT